MIPAATPPPVLSFERTVPPPARSDPLRSAQPFLLQINWTPPALAAPRPLVAVLDTGVEASASDLAGVVLRGAGRSFVPGAADPGVDEDGHGTHIAGIIAAISGNGVDGSGVSAARVLPITIADREGRATTAALVRGLRYAVGRGARVINISFGGRGFSSREQAAIDDATRSGALVVAPVGNSDGRRSPQYPGAYRQVLAVAAVGRDDRLLSLSERGQQVAIAAPGEAVASTRARAGREGSGTGLLARSGTSVATAIVSGAAARLMAQRPSLSASQVRAILVSSARDLPPAGPDSATGAGLVDLAAALATPTPPPEDREPNDDPILAGRLPPLSIDVATRAVGVAGRTGDWRDPRDGYRVRLGAGDRIAGRLDAERPGTLALAVWRPGTPARHRGRAFLRRWLLATSETARPSAELIAIAPEAALYTLEVVGVRGESGYAAAGDYFVTIAAGGFATASQGSRMPQR